LLEIKLQTVTNAASQIHELIGQARKVLLITTGQNGDHVAATLALANTIESAERQILFATPNQIDERLLALPGADRLNQGLAPTSLVISLDYKPGSISKVSYAAEGNKFNFVITPSNGTIFSPDNVTYSYTNAGYDLIITVGVADLSLLSGLYESERRSFGQLPLINIDNSQNNSQFGKINAINTNALTVSEVVTQVVTSSRLTLTPVAGQLLMTGLREGTNDFTHTTPNVFETAAEISRLLSVRGESTEERLINQPFRQEKEVKH
jgi:nanoRNase/pAp phosphatase (c-di-AMP/oligoRNAs hydrolase)